jgi:hypothetical protein
MAQEAPGEIIIGIPGLWPTRTDLITSVVSKTFLCRILYCVKEKS